MRPSRRYQRAPKGQKGTNRLARSIRMKPVSGAIAIRSCRSSACRSRPEPLPAHPMMKMGPPLPNAGGSVVGG